MLTKCPECDLRVSDKAVSCPHCGYPFRKDAKVKKQTGKKRLPNGFGQITRLNNPKLRNQYRAMVTVGKNAYGKPICKLLKPQSYFPTYNAAYEALVEYNKNPYELDSEITVKYLYEQWTKQYFETLHSDTSIRNIRCAWSYCISVYDMRVRDLRARHIKGCIDNGSYGYIENGKRPTASMKERIKSLFNLMLDYALEYELVDKNYSRTFNISDDVLQEIEEQRRGHLPFTDGEMDMLWDSVDIIPYVDVLLIQCYSGWRPQELGLLRLENIIIENDYMVGGMKTEAGKNRIVPIHPRIKPLILRKIKEAVELKSEYLINCTDGATHKSSMMMTYDKYQQRFTKIRDRLGLDANHRAHDGRMHFITMAKKYGVDEYAIKRIVGHAISDITEKVYTKRTVDWLKEEIQKIK